MRRPRRHQHHLVLRTNDAVDDAHERHDAHIVIKPAVDDESLKGSIFVALRGRHVGHDALQNLFDPHAGFRRAEHRVRRINPDHVFDFFLGRIGVGAV